MSEPLPPKLKAHHGYRSWTSTWWEGTRHKSKRFGREGEVTRKEAVERFKRWMELEYEPLSLADATMTVTRLCDLYLQHARRIYAAAAHLPTIEAAMKALKSLDGRQLAPTYKAHQLARVRDAMIFKKDKKGRERARSVKTINGRLYVMKQAFVWAATERGLIPEGTAGAMLLVKPLKRGRSEAKDPKKIAPAPFEHVQGAMRASPPVLRDMIELHWLTGMRSAELCYMRPCDVDRATRQYTPAAQEDHRQSHKMEHKGQDRIIPLGPRAWKVLRPYLTSRAPTTFCFSPTEAVQQYLAAKNAARRTPARRGNERGTNVKQHPFIKPGEHYQVSSYRRAIRYACRRAGVPAWHPHQLRHSFGTRARETFGFEWASNALGHDSLDATKLYAERSLKRATEVARKIG